VEIYQTLYKKNKRKLTNWIIITEPEDFSVKALELLKKQGEVIMLTSLSELEIYIEIANVLMIRLGVMWNSTMLAKAPKLRYILTPTTGLDHIDLNYTDKFGIKVISLKGEQTFLNSIPSTAEHSMALILALMRKLIPAHEHVLQDGWDRQAFRGNNLKGKKFGILGFGRIGHQMAEYALAFGMKVSAYDPCSNYNNDNVDFKNDPIELFSDSDIIGIHIPMNEKNRNFISADLLKSAKKGLILINTSRGGVWDEIAVGDCIVNKTLGAIATDVIDNEMEPELRVKSKLIELAKAGYPVLITPHIGGATFESMHETEEFIAQKFIEQI
jgi:D-3-phosphoglycerate dehydrogenase